MVKKANVVLSFENRENAKAFFALLMKVDKRTTSAIAKGDGRMKAMPVVPKAAKKAKKVKAKKTRKTKKGNDIGLTICGPFLFFKNKYIYYFFLLS